MMGRLEARENLFYRFRIEAHVPQNHLLRRIDWLTRSALSWPRFTATQDARLSIPNLCCACC